MHNNDEFKNNIEIVIEYLINNNGTNPRRNEMYKGICLSRTMTKIKSIYNKGKLLEDGSRRFRGMVLDIESINKLNSINFEFKNKTSEELFDKNVTLLKEYLTKHNFDTITRFTSYKNFSLGEWVYYLRYAKKNGIELDNGNIVFTSGTSRRIITPKQLDILNELSFVWNTNEFEVNTTHDYLIKRRILHYQLNRVLQESKNSIDSKEDVENLNKKLIKILD